MLEIIATDSSDDFEPAIARAAVDIGSNWRAADFL